MLSLLVSWLALAGCGGTTPWWVDQLEPDGPCLRVNLLDGLDTRSTAEVHDLFDCVNQQGALDAWVPVDDALDVETRPHDGEAVPAGVELARAVNRLGALDVDALGVAGVLLAAVTAPPTAPGGDRPIDDLLDLTLELGWGAPADEVRSGAVRLDDPAALQAGVVTPLRPVVPVLARTLLDDDLAAATFLGDVAADAETRRWFRAAVSVVQSDDPAIAGPLTELVPHLGEAILAARSPQNDRWPSASGDSLRDLATFYVVQDRPVVEAISPAMHQILGDPAVRAALVPTIDALAADGSLSATPEAIAWMAGTDVDGSALAADEVSALYRFVRLIADNNQPVDCSIDLVVTTLDWQFDNLAVATLQLVAGLEPGQVRDLAALVSTLADNPLTEPLLELAVDSGVCPSFTRQTLDDLRALEVLQQPEALPLLTGVVAVLDVLRGGTVDHLPAAADLAQALFEAGGLEPIEESLRDLGPSPVAEDLAALIEALAHPEEHGVTAGHAPPPTLEDALVLLDWAFAEDPDTGETGLQRVRPWIVPMLDNDDGWVAGGNLARRMADRGTVTSELLPLLGTVAALDPELSVLDTVAALLADPELAGPAFRIAERADVVDVLFAETSPAGEVPVAFWGRLVVHGALEDVLRMVDAVTGALGG